MLWWGFISRNASQHISIINKVAFQNSDTANFEYSPGARFSSGPLAPTFDCQITNIKHIYNLQLYIEVFTTTSSAAAAFSAAIFTIPVFPPLPLRSQNNFFLHLQRQTSTYSHGNFILCDSWRADCADQHEEKSTIVHATSLSPKLFIHVISVM